YDFFVSIQDLPVTYFTTIIYCIKKLKKSEGEEIIIVWFNTDSWQAHDLFFEDHITESSQFHYYFCQREAIETLIYGIDAKIW
ncbi:MAG: hypothetical protein ACE5KE_15005, partial [Methanosarcinales archaeon]